MPTKSRFFFLPTPHPDIFEGMRHLSTLFLFALCFLLLRTSHANPPVVLPYTPDYDGDYDLFGGENYMTNDDNLMLYSLTASHGMSLLEKTQAAMTNLKRLTDPLLLAKLRAPIEMQRQLYLILYWLGEADMANADVQEVLQQISRRGQPQPTPADATMAEVLLFNFHTARHLGVLGFPGLVKLAQALPPTVTENDNNDQNRLAFSIPVLPATQFSSISHQLFNYEIFDGSLPRATSATLTPSQIEFAQKLISRGLLPPDSLKKP